MGARFGVVLALLAVAPVHAATVSADGLKLEVGAGGAITEVVAAGRGWPLAAGPSGLLLRDAAADGPFVAAGGTVRQDGPEVVQAGELESLSLRFELRYRGVGAAVRADGRIVDTAGRDRAVTVRLALPVDASGGSWWPDLNGREPIAAKVHANTRQVGVGAGGKAATYLWSAVSAPAGELCLAVPPDRFVVHRLEYDGAQKSYRAELDFGLCAAARKYPSRADFSVLLYPADPEWGFRAAAERYYRLFPEAFWRRAKDEGLWMAFTDVATVEDPEDFNFIFHEGLNNLSYDDAHDIGSYQYISPHWGWMWMPDRQDKPTPEFIAQRLKDNLNSTNAGDKRRAEQVMVCGAKDQAGQFHYSIGRAHWAPSNHGPVGWFAMFPANADPELAELGRGPTTGGDALAEVERVIVTTESKRQRLDGIYFDGVDERPVDNYNRDHFAYADAPLTFGTDTLKPVLCGAFSAYEILREVAERMHATGRLTMANGIPSIFPFSCTWLDAGGREVEPSIDSDPVSVELLAYSRALLYQKPYLLLYKPRLEERFDRDLSPYLTDYFHTCLLYAAEPSLFKIFSLTNDEFYYSFFERADWYNRYRPLFAEYVPLARDLGLAGWQPLTGARTDAPGLLIERFGQGRNVYLTVYNPAHQGATVEAEVTLDPALLQLPPGVPSAAELVSGSALPVARRDGGLALTVTVPPRRAAVLNLRSEAAELASFDTAEAARYLDIAAGRLAKLVTHTPEIDFEADLDRDGVPSGFSVYQHPAGSVTYHSDQGVRRSPPRSTRMVLHGKARGTQSVRLPVTPGKRYRVSAWTRTEFSTAGLAHLYVQWVDQGQRTLKNEAFRNGVRETAEWTRLEEEVTVPDGAAFLSLVLVATRQGEGDATVWFDDPEVTELAEAGAVPLLPIPPPAAPKTAGETAGRLAGLQRRVGAADGELAERVERLFGQAAETAALAGALKADGEPYGRVPDAVEVAASRLERAARLLVGARLAVTGGGQVAAGDPAAFEVVVAAGPVPLRQVALTLTPPSGWRAKAEPRCPETLVAGQSATVKVILTAGEEAALTGTLTVAAAGETASGRRVELRGAAALAVRPACLSSLVGAGFGPDGTTPVLVLRAANIRRERPLPVTLRVSPPPGFTVKQAPARLSIPPGGRTELPIELSAAPETQAGWTAVEVIAEWDGGRQAHRLPLLYLPAKANLFRNGGFEEGGDQATPWSGYPPGKFQLEPEAPHSGARSIRAVNGEGVAGAGAVQTVVLNQTSPRGLVVRGWSRYTSGEREELKTIGQTEHTGSSAAATSGDYALYTDLHYVGGGALYGRTAQFDRRVTGWQFAQVVIPAAKPLKDAVVYCLFRNQRGTAWFDDLFVGELPPNLAASAEVSVDGSYGGYTPAALTDAVLDPAGLDWSKAAWASAESAAEHWVELRWPNPVTITRAVLWWALDGGKLWPSRSYTVEARVDGAWRPLAQVTDAPETDPAVHVFAPVSTTALRIRQAAGGGPAQRPNLIWLREVEVY